MKYITINGQKKIKDELSFLTTIRRKEISEELKYATSLGDLRENSEYDAVCEEYQATEKKIYELEKILNTSVVYKRKMNGKVEIGCIVTIKIDDEEEVYEIVGYGEADIDSNKISYESLVAKALLGKTIGDNVVIKSEYGSYEVKIINIK